MIRDADRDNQLDFDATTSVIGNHFKINIHRSNATTESTQVDGWSAGCQVFAKAAEWNEFIALCDDAEKKYDQRFSYTLLKVEDIIQAVV